jgi:phage terminase small subunit
MSRAKGEAEAAIFAEPDTLTAICDYISSGDTLYKVSQKIGVRYGRLHSWLHNDPDRLAPYAKALESRQGYVSDIVLDGLMNIARLDMRRLFDKDGRLLEISEIPEEVAQMLSSIEVDQVIKEDDSGNRSIVKTAKVRVPDRLKGFSDLGRSVGMFKDKVEHSGAVKVQASPLDEHI